MERKIGEEFEYNGVRLKVVENNPIYGLFCIGCFFRRNCDLRKENAGECLAKKRTDQTDVKFIRAEK